MMMIKVEIKRSPIHGQGVFALKRVRADAIVWQFEPGLDQKWSDEVLQYTNEGRREFVLERGYLNSRGEWVVCCDEAQFLNFPISGEPANTKLGGKLDGEYLLVASKDIEPGEEITVPPESDGDYGRKMEARRS
jgi:hypothetical protein